MFPTVELAHDGRHRGPGVRRDRARQVGAALRGTQIKGDGETHPFLSPTTSSPTTRPGTRATSISRSSRPTTCWCASTRARALQLGLQLEQQFGTNPYKFGMIGSTDSTRALAAAKEDNFFGKHSGTEPSPRSAGSTRWPRSATRSIPAGSTVASGYAAVWAKREHARGDLRRHEAQGDLRHDRVTDAGAVLRRLGLRHRRRHEVAACPPTPATPRACRWAATCWAIRPAARRVPGRGLEGSAVRQTSTASRSSRAGSTPTANTPGEGLQRGLGRRPRQLDAMTASLSAGRQHGRRRQRHLDEHHRRPELGTVWTDPEFDPKRSAGLLLRPGARDPDAALDRLRRLRYGITMDPEVPMVHQERAYTSPICRRRHRHSRLRTG